MTEKHWNYVLLLLWIFVIALCIGLLSSCGYEGPPRHCVHTVTEERPTLIGKIIILQPYTYCDRWELNNG